MVRGCPARRGLRLKMVVLIVLKMTSGRHARPRVFRRGRINRLPNSRMQSIAVAASGQCGARLRSIAAPINLLRVFIGVSPKKAGQLLSCGDDLLSARLTFRSALIAAFSSSDLPIVANQSPTRLKIACGLAFSFAVSLAPLCA